MRPLDRCAPSRFGCSGAIQEAMPPTVLWQQDAPNEARQHRCIDGSRWAWGRHGAACSGSQVQRTLSLEHPRGESRGLTAEGSEQFRATATQPYGTLRQLRGALRAAGVARRVRCHFTFKNGQTQRRSGQPRDRRTRTPRCLAQGRHEMGVSSVVRTSNKIVRAKRSTPFIVGTLRRSPGDCSAAPPPRCLRTASVLLPHRELTLRMLPLGRRPMVMPTGFVVAREAAATNPRLGQIVAEANPSAHGALRQIQTAAVTRALTIVVIV
jgi:hypothetical protein